jgi:hypothetical protein
MQQAAVLLMIAGFGSIGLNLIGMEFKFLAWVDLWGPTVGWVIRAGFAAVGVVLFLIARHQQASEAPAAN